MVQISSGVENMAAPKAWKVGGFEGRVCEIHLQRCWWENGRRAQCCFGDLHSRSLRKLSHLKVKSVRGKVTAVSIYHVWNFNLHFLPLITFLHDYPNTLLFSLSKYTLRCQQDEINVVTNWRGVSLCYLFNMPNNAGTALCCAFSLFCQASEMKPLFFLSIRRA